jgi:hypothetical protein
MRGKQDIAILRQVGLFKPLLRKLVSEDDIAACRSELLSDRRDLRPRGGQGLQTLEVAVIVAAAIRRERRHQLRRAGRAEIAKPYEGAGTRGRSRTADICKYAGSGHIVDTYAPYQEWDLPVVTVVVADVWLRNQGLKRVPDQIAGRTYRDPANLRELWFYRTEQG